MVTFIGHGILEKFSREFQVRKTTTVGELVDQLCLPENLHEILIPVKESTIISMDDYVNDNDVIHLFMELNGG